jgi:hypothetical protein
MAWRASAVFELALLTWRPQQYKKGGPPKDNKGPFKAAWGEFAAATKMLHINHGNLLRAFDKAVFVQG